MELQYFVTETIKALMQGVENAKETATRLGGRVNPVRSSGTNDADQFGIEYEGDPKRRPLTMIDFDIAVTASEQKEKETGGSIKVWSLSLGGKRSGSDSNQTVSRIKFLIGVVLPHH